MVNFFKTKQGYYYKKWKNGKTKRISKIEYDSKHVQHGGNNFQIDYETIDEIKELLNHNVEYCGNFIDNYEYLSIDGQPNPGGLTNDRKSCNYKYYSPIIWHTHPVSSKYYPSVEDIVKVLKHDIITHSFIFTPFGYWILNYDGVFLHWTDPKLSVFIEQCNKLLYESTNRGTTFNQEAIDNYCRRLNKIINIQWYNFQ